MYQPASPYHQDCRSFVHYCHAELLFQHRRLPFLGFEECRFWEQKYPQNSWFWFVLELNVLMVISKVFVEHLLSKVEIGKTAYSISPANHIARACHSSLSANSLCRQKKAVVWSVDDIFRYLRSLSFFERRALFISTWCSEIYHLAMPCQIGTPLTDLILRFRPWLCSDPALYHVQIGDVQ